MQGEEVGRVACKRDLHPGGTGGWEEGREAGAGRPQVCGAHQLPVSTKSAKDLEIGLGWRSTGPYWPPTPTVPEWQLLTQASARPTRFTQVWGASPH